MTVAKDPGKKARRRNVLIVLLLFGATGGLIVFARLMPASSIPGETAEMAERRADRENNGWYRLEQVFRQMPTTPPKLWGPLEDDPSAEGIYTPKPGSLGQLLRVQRPDNDPLMQEYLSVAPQLLVGIREVLAKPFLLVPLDYPYRYMWSSPDNAKYQNIHQKSRAILPLLVAHATILIEQPDGTGEAARVLRETFELLDRMREGSVAEFFFIPDTYVYDLWPRLCAEHQRETLRWALEMQSRERPSMDKIAFDLRQYKEYLDSLMSQGSVLHPIEAVVYVRDRSRFLRHFAYAFKTARLYRIEYDQLVKEDPVFEGLNHPGYGFPYFENANFNTAWDEVMGSSILILALELYRHDHAEFPQSLDPLMPEYVPNLPDDPHRGRGVSFEYAQQEGGYRIGNRTERWNYEFVRKPEAGENN